MSAPHHDDSSRSGPDRVRTPAERAADAARAMQVRATRRRDRLAAAGGAVLDELLAPGQPRPPWTKTAVAAFYGVGEAAVGQVRRGYAAEFRRDGWRADGGAGEQFSERAVVRVGLLLAHSEVAAELRYRLGMDAAAPLRYSDTEQRVEQCRRHYEDALALVEDTRHLDPADVWRSLLATDHHDLIALAVTLAALVPTDRPELGRWVKDMSAADAARRSVARGLALLIPTRPRLHALPVTAPLRSVPVGGQP